MGIGDRKELQREKLSEKSSLAWLPRLYVETDYILLRLYSEKSAGSSPNCPQGQGAGWVFCPFATVSSTQPALHSQPSETAELCLEQGHEATQSSFHPPHYLQLLVQAVELSYSRLVVVVAINPAVLQHLQLPGEFLYLWDRQHQLTLLLLEQAVHLFNLLHWRGREHNSCPEKRPSVGCFQGSTTGARSSRLLQACGPWKNSSFLRELNKQTRQQGNGKSVCSEHTGRVAKFT